MARLSARRTRLLGSLLLLRLLTALLAPSAAATTSSGDDHSSSAAIRMAYFAQWRIHSGFFPRGAGVFDGIDIDWEYPAAEGAPGNVVRPEDTRNFTLLLAELRRQLDALGRRDHRHYLLTAALPAGFDKIAKIEVDRVHTIDSALGPLH